MKESMRRFWLCYASGVAMVIGACGDVRNAETYSCVRSLESRLIEMRDDQRLETAKSGDWIAIPRQKGSEVVMEMISKRLIDCRAGESAIEELRNGRLTIWKRSSGAKYPEIVIAEKKPSA